MKKKLLLVLMVTMLSLMAFGTISVSAESSGTCGNNLNWILDDSGKLTITGEGNMTDYQDTANPAPWHSDESKIKNVIIKDGVTNLSDYAFYGCKDLTTVSLPDTLTSIGKSAFADCTGITSITIPDKVTSIGGGAFKGCTALTSITIPEGVTCIEDNTFCGCTNLTSVTIPESVTGICYGAFEACKCLTGITIPDKVTSIGDGAFKGCTKLTSITIPAGVTSIGTGAFEDCTGLKSATIPDSITSISNGMFKNCIALTSITIPNNVKSIGDDAFNCCIALTDVTIPDSVTSIGDGAFHNCIVLKSVDYNGTIEKWEAVSKGSYNTYLTEASRKYFWYVTLCKMDETEISKKKQYFDTNVDVSAVEIPEGYEMVLYTDKEQTTVYDKDTPIDENLDKNLVLYVDFVKLSTLEFEGATTADIGEQGIIQKVSFATDKEVKYLSCTLKVPNALAVREIKSDIFDMEKSCDVNGDYTYHYLFLIYSGDGNIPTYKKLNAFEIVFDVSETTAANDILSVEIWDDSSLADDKGNSYGFTAIGKAEITINPILAETIFIVGADEIDEPTKYEASVLPENTTEKDVVWTVSDETIATVSGDGILTPVKKGTVTVTATAKDKSGVSGSKEVSVKVFGKVSDIKTDIGTWNVEYSEQTTDYTIYVPKTATSIDITAKHDGMLQQEGFTLPNNITRKVMLPSDKKVLELAYTCDGYDDNEYKITIIKFEGTKTEVSEDKKSFTVKPINIETGNTVILALYNGDALVEMQQAIYEDEGSEIHFTATKEYTNAKVMVWGSFETLKPICNAEAINWQM